jgi:hypothetical protein
MRLLATFAAGAALAACTQTSLLKPESGNSASATVESLPVLFGKAHISVSIDGKMYVGDAGGLAEDETGTQARRFGWEPAHKHPNIKQEIKFLYGSTSLTAADGDKLECDHLRHGDDWRLRCKRPGNGEVAFQRVTK